jgi:ferredoxin
MVWDTFGQQLAQAGARMFDTLPVLSEPTSRAFTGEQPVPTVFFFLNLFAHIGVPLSMGVVFWLHVKRLHRPLLLPPRPLLWATVAALAAVAIVWPLEMAPKADPFVLPERIPTDMFVAFWLPLVRNVGGGTALVLAVAVGLGLVAVPLATRRGAAAPSPSTVDEDVCTGCTQCAVDCPYGAITMIARVGRRSDLVARVDPALCVSCGICSGSCAPMGVGPAGRTGRDQLAMARQFLESPARRTGEVVVVACQHGAAAFADDVAARGAVPYPVSCSGNLHTSIIEVLLRGGCGGVLVLACPPRDCWNREGPIWLHERVYHEREAELQARVDRTRVRIEHAGPGERARAIDAVATFVKDIAALDSPIADTAVETDTSCDPVPIQT